MIRRLPAIVVRALVALDLILCLHPAWAWFLMWRWTGRAVGPVEGAKLYWRAIKFVVRHLQNAGAGTGAWTVDWLSPPVRRASWPEQPSWATPGSCGTCRQCCATPWLPPEQSVACPFLGEKGCQVYGGVFWDYGNCGRYPESAQGVRAYRCPRFLPIAA